MPARTTIGGRIALGAAALAAVAGPAVAADCPVPAAPKVVVDNRTVPVAVETDLTAAEISKRARANRSVDLLIDKSWDMTPSFAVEPRDRQFCAVPSELRVTVTYKKRIIAIARELAVDGCVKREVLAHQNRHVRAEEQAVMSAGDAASQDLRRFLVANPVATRATRDEATAAMQARLEDWLTQWRAAIDSDTRSRRDDILNAAERKRLQAACDGRGRALLAEVAPPAAAGATPASLRPTAASPSAPLPEAVAAAALMKALGTLPPVPVPAAPPAPAFNGAIEPITTPLVLKIRPFAERPAVTANTIIRTAGGQSSTERTVTTAYTKIERRGGDLVLTSRSDEKGRPATIPVATMDEFGKIKQARGERSADAPEALTDSLIQTVIDEAVAVSRGAFPPGGVRTGDDIGPGSLVVFGAIKVETRLVVRGLATHEGRRVVVVDVIGSGGSPLSNSVTRGYSLIDAELGSSVFSHSIKIENERKTRDQIDRVETRSVTRVVAPAVAAR